MLDADAARKESSSVVDALRHELADATHSASSIHDGMAKQIAESEAKIDELVAALDAKDKLIKGMETQILVEREKSKKAMVDRDAALSELSRAELAEVDARRTLSSLE